jgi:hypothetical protein
MTGHTSTKKKKKKKNGHTSMLTYRLFPYEFGFCFLVFHTLVMKRCSFVFF